MIDLSGVCELWCVRRMSELEAANTLYLQKLLKLSLERLQELDDACEHGCPPSLTCTECEREAVRYYEP